MARPDRTTTPTLRVNRVAPPSERSRNRIESLYTRRGTTDEVKGKNPYRKGVDRTVEAVKNAKRNRTEELFTRRGANPNRSKGGVAPARTRHPYGGGYRGGYRKGYTYGYRDGYHYGYHRGYYGGHYYRHHHYYGPHLVFGFHYGGFGFYAGHWHFAIVIGSPIVTHHVHHYHYAWWDGYGTSLVTWDQATRSYPASYTFTGKSCVELLIITTAGENYAVQVNPGYWEARDPGDLYAALWAQLERDGELYLEDINGAVHVFPAGLIQQIEARGCR